MRSHVRKTFTHGINLSGQLGVLLGEGGDGFFESISGGTAGTVLRRNSRSDQSDMSERKEKSTYAKLLLENGFLCFIHEYDLLLYNGIAPLWPVTNWENRITVLSRCN